MAIPRSEIRRRFNVMTFFRGGGCIFGGLMLLLLLPAPSPGKSNAGRACPDSCPALMPKLSAAAATNVGTLDVRGCVDDCGSLESRFFEAVDTLNGSIAVPRVCDGERLRSIASAGTGLASLNGRRDTGA
mmetsp:Transcript_14772/g.27018  ORF Transcript_14772/g.27018 Transcript_14772/m.27018 type:complete len:130 (-) Transcript_14772:307-696(-)